MAATPLLSRPVSQLVSQAQIEEVAFRRWSERLPIYSRKRWEFAYIAQAVEVHGMLVPGARGLGFGVGREPLAALFAAHGLDIVATDRAEGGVWAESGQHATGLADLPWVSVCPWEEFSRRVTFRQADMRAIPADLLAGAFDFVWSCGSIEHLGSLDAGMAFVKASLACVRPGGLAVHTTDYNLSSDGETLDHGDVVAYRQRDLVRLAEEIAAASHRMELNLSEGAGELDRYVDRPPYRPSSHLRMELGGFVLTSVGLIIEKAGGARDNRN